MMQGPLTDDLAQGRWTSLLKLCKIGGLDRPVSPQEIDFSLNPRASLDVGKSNDLEIQPEQIETSGAQSL